MYIVTVIPLSRGINKENLTYFTVNNIPLGTVVSVQIRNKEVNAIVINKESLSSAKEAVKASNFKLKKVVAEKGPFILSSEFFCATLKAKDYFATTTGATLFSLLPNIFLNNCHKIKNVRKEISEKQIISGTKNEKLVLMASDEDRIDFYKKLIRQNLAHKEGTLICVPTGGDAKIFKESVDKGIEEFFYIFENENTPKKYLQKIESAMKDDHRSIFVVTPAHFYLASLIPNIKTIVIEKESSNIYKSQVRPFLDIRVFAEILVNESRQVIIFGDRILRAETISKVESKEFFEVLPISYRTKSTIKKELVNVKESWQKRKKFFAISTELTELVKKTIESKKKIFIFCLRKGLSGVVVCNDCKTPIECEKCKASVALYGATQSGKILLCNKCGNRKFAKESPLCKICQSWNLVSLGIGIDKVEGELSALFPKVKIARFDGETVRSAKEAEKITSEFYSKDISICLGTEMAFYYLKERVDYSAIASIDSLFSMPNFRASEKALRILLETENLAREQMLIQTKNVDDSSITAWHSGNLSEFYKNDLSDRKTFGYPPFTTIAKVTLETKNGQYEKEKLFGIFSDHKPIFILSSSKKGKVLLQMIIKIPKTAWCQSDPFIVDKTILSKLTSLPPSYTTEIDPENMM